MRTPSSPGRRSWLAAVGAAWLSPASPTASAAASSPTSGPRQEAGIRLCTFGDSILDCGHYNEHGIDPGRLLIRNDDALFPEFRGRDLSSRGPARLEHRAVAGATVEGLEAQARGLQAVDGSVALLTIGGNDLLRGLASDTGPGLRRFEAALDAFLRRLPIRPVILGNVYDPTFGDDERNFLGVPARIARANHRRVNEAIAERAGRHGRLADLHGHFLGGRTSWYTRTIEPSLEGASEIRRVFLRQL